MSSLASDLASDKAFVRFWMAKKNQIPIKDRIWGREDFTYATAFNQIRYNENLDALKRVWRKFEN